MKNKINLIDKKYFLGLVLILTSLSCIGQTTFQKSYGGSSYEHGYDIIQTNDEGFAITGETKSFGAGDFDVYLMKTDKNGNLLWSKTFGGIGHDKGDRLIETSDGGFLIGGQTKSFGPGWYFVSYLIKTDSIGNLIWSKTYDGSGLIGSIKEVSDGFIFSSNGIIKVDFFGNLIWSKRYFSSNMGDIEIKDIQNTTDGGYILAGSKDSSIAYHQVYIMKIDSLLNVEWSKVYFDGSQSQAFSVIQTLDGGYAITGYSFFNNSHKVLFTKIDNNGNLDWFKTIGPSGNNRALKISELSNGSFIMSGYSYNGWSNDFAFVKSNSIGDIEWFKRIGSQGGDEHSYSHIITGDGAVALTGFTYGFGADTGDVYLVKTDTSGIIGCNQTSPVATVLSPVTNVGVLNVSENQVAITIGNPATIAGSGGNESIICSVITAVQEHNTNATIKVYPNPVSSTLIIECTQEIDQIEIISLLGNRILTQNFNKGQNQKRIDVQSLKSGIYFYYLQIDQEVYSGKFSVIK